MDPLGNLPTTHPIQMGWDNFLLLYPKCRFGCINISDCRLGNTSFPIRTGTQSGCPEPFPSLGGAFVWGILLSQWRFATFAFISQYWNTNFWTVIQNIRRAATWRFDCRYACFGFIMALSVHSELAFKRLQSWRIWSEKWLRGCIFTKLTTDWSTWCCAIYDSICASSSLKQWCFATTGTLFEAGLLSHSFCLSKVSCVDQTSETFFVDLVVPNRVQTSLWQWNSSNNCSMHSIVASVWY